MVTTLAGSGTGAWGDGVGTAASFNWPFGSTLDTNGAVYVAEYNNHRIRIVSSAGMLIMLFLM